MASDHGMHCHELLHPPPPTSTSTRGLEKQHKLASHLVRRCPRAVLEDPQLYVDLFREQHAGISVSIVRVGPEGEVAQQEKADEAAPNQELRTGIRRIWECSARGGDVQASVGRLVGGTVERSEVGLALPFCGCDWPWGGGAVGVCFVRCEWRRAQSHRAADCGASLYLHLHVHEQHTRLSRLRPQICPHDSQIFARARSPPPPKWQFTRYSALDRTAHNACRCDVLFIYFEVCVFVTCFIVHVQALPHWGASSMVDAHLCLATYNAAVAPKTGMSHLPVHQCG